MLQIIGWLGCVMLAVKLLEMHANPTLRMDDGEMKNSAAWGVILGWAGVVIFGVWLLLQGSAFPADY